MTVKLANLITFDTSFAKYTTQAMSGEEFGFAWNTWETGGTGANVMEPWVGQTSLGRIYRKYRIINSLTKFKFVPTGTSYITNTDTNPPVIKYRGDVYFYCIQSDSAVSPLSGLAPSVTGNRIGTVSPVVLKGIMQLPGIKLKRRRWAEVPQTVNMTYGCNMPLSTRVGKNPDYADDTGPFAGTITPGSTPTYTDPATVLYMYFGWFLVSIQTHNSGADLPSYKLEMRDVTLCTYSDVTPDSGDL